MSGYNTEEHRLIAVLWAKTENRHPDDFFESHGEYGDLLDTADAIITDLAAKIEEVKNG